VALQTHWTFPVARHLSHNSTTAPLCRRVLYGPAADLITSVSALSRPIITPAVKGYAHCWEHTEEGTYWRISDRV